MLRREACDQIFQALPHFSGKEPGYEATVSHKPDLYQGTLVDTCLVKSKPIAVTSQVFASGIYVVMKRRVSACVVMSLNVN